MTTEDMLDMLNRFALRLGALRESQGLTRRDLAERVAPDVGDHDEAVARAVRHLAKLEAGHITPNLVEIAGLSDGLNVTPAVLLEGVL